jgi:hypothetical protein
VLCFQPCGQYPKSAVAGKLTGQGRAAAGEYGWDRFGERIKTSRVSVPGSYESMFTLPAELADALIGVAAH